MVLLLGPLAAVDEVSVESIQEYLECSSAEDCQQIYQAIAMASPGGLGKANQHDVNLSDAPEHILHAMKLSASHDMIARQYGNGFTDIIEFVWPSILSGLQAGQTLADSVIQSHLVTMHQFPDSLIARKNGDAIGKQSAAMAAAVIDSGPVGSEEWHRAISDFDFWLRSDGNRRNPGTTADMIAAALFVGLRRGQIDFQKFGNT